MESKLQKRYGLFTAITMVVGIVIGSGVFFKAQAVLQATGARLGLGILAWLIGGIVMLACALTFSVMATRYGKVNGVVDYAEATCGSGYSYYLGWLLTMAYYPTLTSVLAWVSARYTCVLFGLPDPVTGAGTMALALFFMVMSFALNTLSPKLAGKLQVSATFLKLIPLVLMAVVGIAVGLINGQLTDNFNTDTVADVLNRADAAELGAALLEGRKPEFLSGYLSVGVGEGLLAAAVSTAFAYEGWIVATSINAELKNPKRTLPLALTIGSIVVISVYIFYYIGVAGGAGMVDLLHTGKGAPTAFTNLFGAIGGKILQAFIVVSCLGTLNGLMLGCTRGMYAIAVREEGPAPEVFSQVDRKTNMPNNSAILGLLLCAAWFLYFYGSQLGGWFGDAAARSEIKNLFAFDSSELPIVSLYAMYIPIFLFMMIKEKDLHPVKRFLLPSLAVGGALFMVFAACYAHKYQVLGYLVIYALMMGVAYLFRLRDRKKKAA